MMIFGQCAGMADGQILRQMWDADSWRAKQRFMNDSGERWAEAFQASLRIQKVGFTENSAPSRLQSDRHFTRHAEKMVRAQEFAPAGSMMRGHEEKQEIVGGDIRIEMGRTFLAGILRGLGKLGCKIGAACDHFIIVDHPKGGRICRRKNGQINLLEIAEKHRAIVGQMKGGDQ